MARVVLEHVSKNYPGPRGENILAVADFNLAIADREFLVLVGPSGCGKSTTLRLIAGLEELTQGKIWMDDRLINDLEPKDRDVAMVFQNYALYPHMTVSENLGFALKLRKCPKTAIVERVQEVARMLGLEACLDRLPRALSGGERQRVALGRAIARQPKAFLFDEPLSNLDARMRGEMRMELSRLHQRLAATMIYVTHDQVEAMTMGDRIAVMDRGRLQQAADPLTLYHQPANLFVAGFIGSPPINLLSGTIRQDHTDLFFRATAATHPADEFELGPLPEWQGALHPYADKSITLGIRPESLGLSPPTNSGAGAASARATIEWIEPLGPETYFHLARGPWRLIARLPPRTTGRPGDEMEASFDLAKLHFFDTLTGKAISR